MSTTSVSAAPPRLSARRAFALWAGAFALVSFIFLAFVFIQDRPPSAPQLTLLGGTDELHILAEGAGGGRVLIGGGSNGSELPAMLGRQFLPSRRDLDLLIVVDRRDLIGASELVRRGQARAVLTVGLDADRSAAPALAALRELCALERIPLRSLAAPERISLGRDGALTLDLYPARDPGAAPRLRLAAGVFSAAIVVGEETPDPALAVIVPRVSQERLRAASAGPTRFLIASTVPAETPFSQVLPVAAGQRATLALDGTTMRLRGGSVTTLDTARTAR